MRKTAKRTIHNRRYISGARSYVKRVRALIAEDNLDEATTVARKAYSTLDKAARRGILHPRNAARRKGRLMAALAAAKSAKADG